jgi:iron complex transport system ATP-binding protein
MSALLTLDGLTVRAGTSTLLEDVSLTVDRGDLVVLLGPNGAGKSTLLHSILGLMNRTVGSVHVEDRSVDSLGGAERARYLAWLPQHGLVTEPLTVQQFVAAARFRFSESRASALRASSSALDEVGVAPLADRTLDTLSGGEAQKVALAALVAQDASIFLLDEPGNHLDPSHQFELYGWIGRQWSNGRTLICATHDINLLGHIAPPDRIDRVRVVGMSGGHIQFESTFGDSTLSDHLYALFQVPFQSLEVGGRRHLIAVPGEAEGVD